MHWSRSPGKVPEAFGDRSRTLAGGVTPLRRVEPAVYQKKQRQRRTNGLCVDTSAHEWTTACAQQRYGWPACEQAAARAAGEAAAAGRSLRRKLRAYAADYAEALLLVQAALAHSASRLTLQRLLLPVKYLVVERRLRWREAGPRRPHCCCHAATTSRGPCRAARLCTALQSVPGRACAWHSAVVR